ncbi:MAG: aldehyde dehydrogenase [Rhodospirillaceae bacterium]
MTFTSRATSIDPRHFGQFFIGGAWVSPSTDKTLDVVSPVTEEVVFRVAEARPADVDKAVAAARTAFDSGPWPRMPPLERAEYLKEFARILRTRAEDFAVAWTETTGVVRGMALSSPEYSIGAFDRSIDQASSFDWIEKHPTGNGMGLLVREPVGVVAAIAPWNAPLATMLTKIAPALMAGCPVVMKPAPQTPIEAYIIAECAEAAKLPPGVVNLFTAEREASDHLVRHPDIDKISFTGSLATGQHIAAVGGERIARVTLELGGKSAAIVLDDYDLEKAAKSLVGGICVLSGQNCAGLTRVIVSRARHDELVQHMVAAAQAVTIGDPYDAEIKLGPLTMKSQLEKVEGYIATGVKEGATLATGGKRPAHIARGYYMEPTVFANVDNAMTIAQEEIFGPVLCVIPCDGEDESAREAEAIRIANDSPFGLAGAVYTNDTNATYRIARQLRTGTVGQSAPSASFAIAFGGFKQSGLGREGGVEGLLAYLEPKTILLPKAPDGI